MPDTWKWYLPNSGEDASNAINLPASNSLLDAHAAAEEAAEQYHSNHDGWEARWPVLFAIISPDGTESRFKVDLEMEPVFWAVRSKGGSDG